MNKITPQYRSPKQLFSVFRKLGVDTQTERVYLKTQLNINNQKLEIIMDDLQEQIDFLEAKKQKLIEQLERVTGAIKTLRGESVATKQPAQVPRPKQRGKFQCTSGVIAVFKDNDYLAISEVRHIMAKNGIEQAKTNQGRNAISTTLSRLIERRALEKSETGKYSKTMFWNDGAGTGKKSKRSPRKNKETFETACVKALRRAGEPMHYVELMEKMNEWVGYKVGGKNPKANMTAQLSMSKKVVGLGEGKYTLLETLTKQTE